VSSETISAAIYANPSPLTVADWHCVGVKNQQLDEIWADTKNCSVDFFDAQTHFSKHDTRASPTTQKMPLPNVREAGLGKYLL